MTIAPGTTIALTRSALDNEVWASELRRRGLVAVELPCLFSETLEEQAAPLHLALDRCSGLLFTSPHAVHAVRQLAPELDLDEKYCACVGEATASAARQAGATVQFLSPQSTALSLGRAWLEIVAADVRPCWPRAEQPRAELGELFAHHGRELEALAVYRTNACSTIDLLPAQDVRAIFFASPSAVLALSAASPWPRTALLISIGPSTSAALESAGHTIHGEARERNLAGLLEALEESLRSSSLSK